MSSDFPKVAVLLAAYNGRAWIEEQLASVLAQYNVSVSVYISVDPSTDGTESLCEAFALRHQNVFVLPPSGPFKGAARNFFRLLRDVDFAGYDFISFADQDDVWYPEKLARAIERLEADDVDGYSSNVVAFWPDGRRMLVDKAQPQVRWDHLFEAAGPGCTYVLKPALAMGFKKLIVGSWASVQEVALHDWFCYAYARSHGFKWFIDPVPGMDYRQHNANQVGVNNGWGSALARGRSIVGGWWLGQIRLIAQILSVQSVPVFPHDNFLSKAKLIVGFFNCRRRLRDKVVFLAVWTSIVVFGH